LPLDSLSYMLHIPSCNPSTNSVKAHTHEHTTILRPFFWGHPGEPVPEENFWTLWCKGRLTEADTLSIRLGATPSGLTSAHLHHPTFFTGWMPFLPPSQQRQSTEGSNSVKAVKEIICFCCTTYTRRDSAGNTVESSP